MKRSISLMLMSFVLSSVCIAQKQKEWTVANFETQVLKYKPSDDLPVTDNEKNYAKMILDETRVATYNNPKNFNLADYFNVLSAMLSLNEKPYLIDLAYQKFVAAEGSCDYLIAFEDKVRNTKKYAPIRKAFLKDASMCGNNSAELENFDPNEYAEKNGYKPELINKLWIIEQRDQEFRSTGMEKMDVARQKAYDDINQNEIDELYEYYGRYLGKSLVGDEMKHVMWAVIQHSNVDYMKKYLPVVTKAVQMNELDQSVLKMLIDRYYGLTQGFQVFGTQSGFGFDLAGDKVRDEIIKEFDLD